MQSLINRLLHLKNRILLDLFVLFIICSSERLFVMRQSMSSFLLVNAEHRAASLRRSQIQALYRPQCTTNDDCPFNDSLCNVSQGKCQCKTDFVQVGTFVNKSYISHMPMTCLRIARIDERCVSDHQCIVDYSECRLITQNLNGVNRTSHFCKCGPGHDLEENESTEMLINGNVYRLKPVCSWEKGTTVSWITTLTLVSLLIIFILIATFVASVRYQKWRNQSYQSTITSITSQGMNPHVMGNHHMGSSSPPPMGSVEAEFQNDFIQVFPMHHLEPMPDKDAHTFMMK